MSHFNKTDQPQPESIPSQVELALHLESPLPPGAGSLLTNVSINCMMHSVRSYRHVLHLYDAITQVANMLETFAGDPDGLLAEPQRDTARQAFAAVQPELRLVEAAGYDHEQRLGSCLPDYAAAIGIAVRHPGGDPAWLQSLAAKWTAAGNRSGLTGAGMEDMFRPA